MKLAVDLHIHSALSPCSSNEMTPNNIVNMALLKGLDVIAVTDHNSTFNLPAIMKCAEGTGLTVIPGMELETSEEVHVVCLFTELESAVQFGSCVYSNLPDMPNRDDIFGEQLVINENDEIIRLEKRFLITATGLSLETAVPLVRSAGGIAIPAHIDRNSYSILANLGSVPAGYGFSCLEISKDCDLQAFLAKHPVLSSFSYIKSSDAHRLGDISEKENFIEAEENSIGAILKKLSI